MVERLVDAAARKLGMTPDAIRRKNFIPPRAMPYKTATGKVYDSGDFTAHMKRAMEIANWKEFPKRAKAAKKQGLVRGIGLATYVEVCGTMGEETANVRLDPNGDVTVLIGTQSSGQGHQTAYAQLVAEQFGLPPERVHVLQGDTDKIATGLGTGGSASIPTGGVSVERATRELGEKLRRSPPRRWKPAPAISRSATAPCASPAPTARSALPIWRSGRASIPSKLNASATFAQADGTYPNGTHLAEVEIDPATGIIKIVNYVIVDDFGVTLNPLLLAGQVHGGAMQGIGQALMEQAVYSAEGRPARHRHLHGLCDAARGRRPVIRVRDPQRALQDQSAGRQGRGRGRRDRLLSGGGQRDHRGAVARIQDRSHRHAGDRRSGSGSRSASISAGIVSDISPRAGMKRARAEFDAAMMSRGPRKRVRGVVWKRLAKRRTGR